LKTLIVAESDFEHAGLLMQFYFCWLF
jgi:hypothetical protein